MIGALILVAVSMVGPAVATPAVSDAAGMEPPLPEALAPKVPRSEVEEDQLEAAALFATARLMEQKEEFTAALRYYQRALRCDPTALSIVQEIVPLAFTLGRPAEAVRYALVAAELDGSDPALLQRLAAHLTTEGDFDRALRMYERLRQLQKDQPRDDGKVLLAAQVAKLYLVSDKPQEAAAAYREVMQALADQEAKLNEQTRSVILEDAAQTLEALGAKSERRNNEAAAYDLFGMALLESGDADGALDAFRKANELEAHAGLFASQQAEVAAKKSQWQACLDALGGYFAAPVAARGTAPYELLATALKELGQEGQLIARLENLLADNPDNAALSQFLGQKLLLTGELAKAQPFLAKAIEKRPTLDGYRALVDDLRRQGNSVELLDTLLSAANALRSLDSLGDEFRALLADRAMVDQLMEQARQRAKSAEAPLDADQLTTVAQLALEAKQPAVAAEFFELALAAPEADQTQTLRRWGLGLLLHDEYAAAAQVFRRALDEKLVAEHEAEFHYHLAGALEMAGETDAALAAAQRAVELAEPKATELGDTYYRMVARPPWVLYHGKRNEVAEAEYRKLVERFDARYGDDALRDTMREARLMLSNLAVIRADLPEAERWLEEILDEFPEDVSAQNDLGYLWVDQGKHLLRGLGMIEKAVAAEPTNAAYLDSHGWALHRLGRHDEALRAMEKAVALQPEADGVMLDHLGDCHQAAGQLEQARAAWERAAAAFEKSGDTAKLPAVREKLATPPSS
jgi:tetratricopeptide (TPR) repeat protein